MSEHLNMLLADLTGRNIITLAGVEYSVKNCVAFADTNILKAVMCLSSDDAIEVTVSIDIRSIDPAKKRLNIDKL